MIRVHKLFFYILNVVTVVAIYITTKTILWFMGFRTDEAVFYLEIIILVSVLFVVLFVLQSIAYRRIKLIYQGLSKLNDNPSYRFNKLPGLWGEVTDGINKLVDKVADTKNLIDEVLSNLPVAVLVFDGEGNIVMCNPTARCLFQCQRCDNNRHSQQKKCPYKLLEWTITTGKPIRNYDYYLDLSDGEKKHLIINTEILYDTNESCVNVLLTATDITTRQQMWDQIQQTEKISMISELAAGVAHEIKNPLTSARGLLQLINNRFREDDVARQHIVVALESLDRINVIINEMEQLSLSTRDNLTFSQLEHLLEDISILLDGEAVCHNVTIIRNYQPNLPLAVLDVNQMKQVFLNLALNAINAMPTGGVLTINVSFHQDSNEFEINFCDNGVGMTKEEIQKIFNPFYSSCANNTGLGLTVCYQTIKSHGGRISVQSKSGEGSNFTIYLPTVNQMKNIS
ncbi:ATP-binding protein [Peptococcaceae bacterium 1198_IL3148]